MGGYRGRALRVPPGERLDPVDPADAGTPARRAALRFVPHLQCRFRRLALPHLRHGRLLGVQGDIRALWPRGCRRVLRRSVPARPPACARLHIGPAGGRARRAARRDRRAVSLQEPGNGRPAPRRDNLQQSGRRHRPADRLLPAQPRSARRSTPGSRPSRCSAGWVPAASNSGGSSDGRTRLAHPDRLLRGHRRGRRAQHPRRRLDHRRRDPRGRAGLCRGGSERPARRGAVRRRRAPQPVHPDRHPRRRRAARRLVRRDRRGAADDAQGALPAARLARAGPRAARGAEGAAAAHRRRLPARRRRQGAQHPAPARPGQLSRRARPRRRRRPQRGEPHRLGAGLGARADRRRVRSRPPGDVFRHRPRRAGADPARSRSSISRISAGARWPTRSPIRSPWAVRASPPSRCRPICATARGSKRSTHRSRAMAETILHREPRDGRYRPPRQRPAGAPGRSPLPERDAGGAAGAENAHDRGLPRRRRPRASGSPSRKSCRITTSPSCCTPARPSATGSPGRRATSA